MLPPDLVGSRQGRGPILLLFLRRRRLLTPLLILLSVIVALPEIRGGGGGALDRAREALRAGHAREALRLAIDAAGRLAAPHGAGLEPPPGRRAEVLAVAARARAVLTRRLERASRMRVRAAATLIGVHAIPAARRMLAKAVDTAPLPSAHYELGNLLEFFDSTGSDKTATAAEHYRQAQLLALRRDARWWRGRGAEGDGATLHEAEQEGDGAARPCRAVMAEDVCAEPDVTCTLLNGATADRRQRIARFRAARGVSFSVGGRDGVLFSTTAKAAADSEHNDCRVFVGIHGRAEALHEQWTRFSDDEDDDTEGVDVGWRGRQTSEWERRDRIAVLTQPRSWSFFHFLLEIIPRLCLLASLPHELLNQRAVLLDSRAHALLEETWMPALPRFANEMVRRLELVAFEAEPRGVKLWRSPDVLWVGWTPPPDEVVPWASYFLPAPGPLRLFQSAVRGTGGSRTAPPMLAVVIARNSGGARLRQRVVITNRDAVKTSLTEAGWETHVVSDDSTRPSTAVALFRSAAVVVGVHGGGLANMVFAPTGAHVFEAVVAQPGISPLFARLCTALGHVHHVLPTQDGRMLDYFAGGQRGGAVEVDVAAFETAIAGLLWRRAERSSDDL